MMQSEENFTPLYVASQGGDESTVRALLSGGASVNKATVCTQYSFRVFVRVEELDILLLQVPGRDCALPGCDSPASE
jgi:hypothetical protein